MSVEWIEGRDHRTGLPLRLGVQDGHIAQRELLPADSRWDRNPRWLCPGLVDLQVNGLAGIEFTSPNLTIDEVARACQNLAATGTTRLLPTVTTAPDRTLLQALSTLARAARSGPPLARAMIAGIHLEGPFISPETGPRGAHPLEHCAAPSWESFCRWQQAAQQLIRLVTLAPELPGAVEFIRQVTATGVRVALGHLNASTAQIRAAVQAGACLSTHLGNGAHGLLPRHPNYLWDQLAESSLAASLIVDGHHLPENVVRVFLRCKGPEHVILVSDITSLAGLPPGHYSRTSLGEVEVLENGRLVVAGQRQYLAGASEVLLSCVQNLAQLGVLSPAECWRLASQQPLQLLGLPPIQLDVGDRADVVAVVNAARPPEDPASPPEDPASPPEDPASWSLESGRPLGITAAPMGQDTHWPGARSWQVHQAWVAGQAVRGDSD